MASKKKVTITAEETFAPDRDITLANPVEGTTNVVTEEKVKIQESATSREIFGGESLDTSRLRVRFANTLGNVSARLRSVFEREKTTTDPGVKESIEKEKNKLLREKVRTIRLSEIQIKGEANEREILKKREKFEDLKTSDILYLRQKGADIASLLLVPTDNPLGVVDGGKIEKGQKFTVNFGENKSISRSLGAGDILPATVQKISVNGKVGIYANSPRPGYYTA